MLLTIGVEECLQDSPKFRSILEEQESGLENLEHRMEKVLKVCNSMIESGKCYVANQSLFANTLWELNICFRDDHTTNAQLNKIIHTLQEMNKFQTILLDQATRTIVRNIHSFIKEDIKEMTESKHCFNKISAELDLALQKHSAASKTKPGEIEETTNLLTATRACFRHTALDHLHAITVMHSKKRQVLLSTLLSYIQACRTYYHQGYDLYEGLEPFMKNLDIEMVQAKEDLVKLQKKLNERHSLVNSEDLFIAGNSSTNRSNTTRMQGYLFKRTTNAFKTWNRRWFYLTDKQLVYRKRTGEEHATIMEEDMKLCTVRPVVDSERRFCFEVISPNKIHMVQADSEESYKAWIQALQESIGAAIQDSKSHHNDNDHNATMLEVSMTAKTNVKPKKRMWEALLKIPGNHCCCDCGNTDPKWASINLGITLCIECSGVHRSLGVHFSKVRSLTLDSWEPEVIKVMAELGNKVVNSVYLGNLKPGKESLIITPNCDNMTRESWIKQKYIERKYVKPLHTQSPHLCERKTSLRAPKSVVRKWSVRKIRRRTRSVDKPRKLQKTSCTFQSLGASYKNVNSSISAKEKKDSATSEANKEKENSIEEDFELTKTDLGLDCILKHLSSNFNLADESAISEQIEEKSISTPENIPTSTGERQQISLKKEGNSLFYSISGLNGDQAQANEQNSDFKAEKDKSIWFCELKSRETNLDTEEFSQTKATSGDEKEVSEKSDATCPIKREKSFLYSELLNEGKKKMKRRTTSMNSEGSSGNEKRQSLTEKSENDADKTNSLKSQKSSYSDKLDVKDLSDSSVYTTASENTEKTSDCASFNDLPSIGVTPIDGTDVYMFGESLSSHISEPDMLDLSSNESETESDNDLTVMEDDLSTLNAEMLLYRAATVHNLPVMCHALALGVNKIWTNKNDKDRTYLHQAIISNSVMACEYLILNGAQINCCDSDGKTPLYLATELGHTAQVCLLLKHKADQHIADKSGLEPLTIAVEKANADIVTLLRLGRLNEEMKESNEHGTNDETFNDVVRDFSQLS